MGPWRTRKEPLGCCARDPPCYNFFMRATQAESSLFFLVCLFVCLFVCVFVRSFVCLLVYVFLNVDNIANYSVHRVLFVTYYIYIHVLAISVGMSFPAQRRARFAVGSLWWLSYTIRSHLLTMFLSMFLLDSLRL